MKYHIKNKISRREIRTQRKNIIPMELMKNEITGFRINRDGDMQYIGNSEDVQLSEDDG